MKSTVMKKVLSVAMALTLTCGLAACGSGSSEKAKDEKKEEKKEADRVWERKNVLPDPKYCGFRVWERKNVLPDPRRERKAGNGSGREKHGFRPRNPENSRKSDVQSCRRLRDMLWSRTW